jgi:NAD(P)-dependent dehydrogenase (short-subunit alcohol dehydrogenase family)
MVVEKAKWARAATIIPKPSYSHPTENSSAPSIKWTACFPLKTPGPIEGTFLYCKAVYPQTKRQVKGKGINVSSSTFFIRIPDLVHYVTSRGAIVAFTRALARELGNNEICVSAIASGFTASNRRSR